MKTLSRQGGISPHRYTTDHGHVSEECPHIWTRKIVEKWDVGTTIEGSL